MKNKNAQELAKIRWKNIGDEERKEISKKMVEAKRNKKHASSNNR